MTPQIPTIPPRMPSMEDNSSNENGQPSNFTPFDFPPVVRPPQPQPPPQPVPQPQPRTTPVTTTVVAASGAELGPEQMARAQKLIKWAGSALNYDDVSTAVTNLQKALNLLTTGSEE